MKGILTEFREDLGRQEVADRTKEPTWRKVVSPAHYLEAVPRAVIQAWKIPAKKEKGFFLVTTK